MLQRQRNDQVLVGPGESMRVDDDAAIFHEGRYRALDFGHIVDAARRGLDAEARRGRLQRTPERLMNGRLGMHDHHDSRDVRYARAQQSRETRRIALSPGTKVTMGVPGGTMI